MYGIYTKEVADAIYQFYANQSKAGGISKKPDSTWQPLWYFVKLTENLDAASDPETGYTQATANVVKYSNTADDLDMEVVEDEDFEITVTNRSTGFSGVVDDYMWVVQPYGIAEFIPLVSSGGGGCSSCCSSVRTGNLLHPDLPTGYDETTRDWSFASACGDAIGEIEIPNTDGSLTLVWAGGIPIASFEDVGNTFVSDISADCTILDVYGVDVTETTSFTATITMNFTTKEIVFSWEETV